MDLVALEKICRLKFRYLRCVDLKLWDELGDTFTEDATADYGTPVYGSPLKFNGRAQIVAFMRDNLGPEIITTHFCGQPELDVDGDTATGIWALEDTVIVTEHRVVIKGAAFYEDRYLRVDDVWRIAHTGYVRSYEAVVSLDDVPSFRLTANRWAKAHTG